MKNDIEKLFEVWGFKKQSETENSSLFLNKSPVLINQNQEFYFACDLKFSQNDFELTPLELIKENENIFVMKKFASSKLNFKDKNSLIADSFSKKQSRIETFLKNCNKDFFYENEAINGVVLLSNNKGDLEKIDNIIQFLENEIYSNSHVGFNFVLKEYFQIEDDKFKIKSYDQKTGKNSIRTSTKEKVLDKINYLTGNKFEMVPYINGKIKIKGAKILTPERFQDLFKFYNQSRFQKKMEPIDFNNRNSDIENEVNNFLDNDFQKVNLTVISEDENNVLVKILKFSKDLLIPKTIFKDFNLTENKNFKASANIFTNNLENIQFKNLEINS